MLNLMIDKGLGEDAELEIGTVVTTSRPAMEPRRFVYCSLCRDKEKSNRSGFASIH